MLDLGAEIVSPSKSRMKKDRNFPAIMFKDCIGICDYPSLSISLLAALV